MTKYTIAVKLEVTPDGVPIMTYAPLVGGERVSLGSLGEFGGFSLLDQEPGKSDFSDKLVWKDKEIPLSEIVRRLTDRITVELKEGDSVTYKVVEEFPWKEKSCYWVDKLPKYWVDKLPKLREELTDWLAEAEE